MPLSSACTLARSCEASVNIVAHKSVDLYSLTDILRGGVRIQNNFNLCYVQTVNWSIIVKDDSENIIKNNNERLCSPCQPNCPRQGKQAYCWSATHCQQVCEAKCTKGCTPNGECCHNECAGGCKLPKDSSSCYACHHFNSRGMCIETCFSDDYEYLNYQCVTKKVCSEMGLLLYESKDRNKKECVSVCPYGYSNESIQEREKNVMTCRKCIEPCAKTCPSQLVNTIAKAQKLTGCTKIDGPLIISITGGKAVAKELTASLGMIEEVTHFLWVFESHALISLNFLRSLKVIGGKKLYNGRYALYVHNNDNLEDIWSSENLVNLTITERKASVLFHSNPKLCYKKIKELILRTNRTIPEDSNMHLTNGNKIACTIMEQTVNLEALPDKGVVKVSWTTAPINEDDRMLTGYYVYYKQSEKDINYMTGRDACDDDWSRKYVEITRSEVNISTRLEGLKPDTSYAVYVQTDTVADADKGAKSNISYIKTNPYNPSSPSNLKVIHKGATWMEIAWSPPAFPNGEIVLYIITSRLYPYIVDMTTDICALVLSQTRRSEIEQLEKQDSTSTEVPTTSEQSAEQGSSSTECCQCSSDLVHKEHQEDIGFEDRLFTYIYMRRSYRQKRSDPKLHHQDTELSNFHNGNPSVFTDFSNITTVFPGGKNKEDRLNITNLHQFSRYQIEVTACHEPTHNCSLSSETRLCALCSLHPAKIVETTTKLSEGSMISGLRIVNQTRSEVVVTWSVPADPNGQIIAFILTLQPNSVHVHWSPHQVSDHQRCVSSQFFKEINNTYVLNVTLMDPSQYWLSVQAYTRDADFSNDLSQKVSFSIEDKDDKAHNITLWAILPTVLVLLLVSATIVIIKIKARKEPIKETINPQYLHDTGLPLWTPDAYATISSQHILDCSDLLLEKSCQLGKGNFGIVMKGQLRLESGLIPVAVKQVTDYQAREDILQEAKLMLKLKCYHLVHAYGVVPGPNHMLLVMELMSRGDLLNYLRSLKAQDNDIFSVLSVDHVCAMAIQIADGMAYLASHKIVHRDLAARNCLVDDQLNIKISDFGMTRLTDNDYYKIRETKYFPVRWLPPEYLISSKFTSKSDVWSYGIVLWEILSGGARPYKHLEDNRKVGGRSSGLPPWNDCPEILHPFLQKLHCPVYQQARRIYLQRRHHFNTLTSSSLLADGATFDTYSLYDFLAATDFLHIDYTSFSTPHCPYELFLHYTLPSLVSDQAY
nr:insulin-like growth factor 1 receptor [Cherax quadricarinatus]